MKRTLLLLSLVFVFDIVTASNFGQVNQLRNWSLKDQSKTFEAKYLYTKNEIAFFENQKEELFLLSIHKLSNQDQYYIQYHHEAPLQAQSSFGGLVKVWLILAGMLGLLMAYRYGMRR